MRTSSPSRPYGFTLLEVLLAMVLLATLFAVLLPTLTTAARSWSAAEERVETASARTRALDTLKRLLMEARPLPRSQASENDGLAFLGQANTVLFVSALPPYRSGGGLQVMRLITGELEGQGGLVLDWHPYHPKVATRGVSAKQGRREMLLPGVQGVQLAYLGRLEGAQQAAWHESWEQPRLPRAIRVRVTTLEGEVVTTVARPLLGKAQAAGLEAPSSGG